MTPALQAQHQAKIARQQRFAAAAARYQQRKANEKLEIQVKLIEVAIEQPAKRRDYDTPAQQLATTPVTWRILRAVSDEFDMPVSDIVSRHRDLKYTLPRYVAIGLMLELTQMSYPAIGKRLGGRDHTTVLNGKRRIAASLEGECFRNRFDQLKASITA